MLEKRKRRKQSQFVEGAKMAVTPEAENEPDSLFFFFFLLLSFLTIPFHFRLSSTHFPPCTAASLRGAASRLPSLIFYTKTKIHTPNPFSISLRLSSSILPACNFQCKV